MNDPSKFKISEAEAEGLENAQRISELADLLSPYISALVRLEAEKAVEELEVMAEKERLSFKAGFYRKSQWFALVWIIFAITVALLDGLTPASWFELHHSVVVAIVASLPISIIGLFGKAVDSALFGKRSETGRPVN